MTRLAQSASNLKVVVMLTLNENAQLLSHDTPRNMRTYPM